MDSDSAGVSAGSAALSDAFVEFISASSRLEKTYRDLEQEVARLSGELAERNVTLSQTLAENERIRSILEQTLDSMPCGVLATYDDRKIAMINPEARRLLNLEPASTSAFVELDDLVTRGFDPTQMGVVDGEIQLQETTYTKARWLSVSKKSLRGGTTVASTGDIQDIWIIRDISSRKEAEFHREQTRNIVALAEVANILAHEIKNPLASMELFTGLIAEDPRNAEEWLSNLKAGIRLLGGTVDNVLTFHTKSQCLRTPIDLSTCIRNAVEFVTPLAHQAKVALNYQSFRQPLVISGNDAAVRQIIINLATNAIRHTPAGGAVVVSLSKISRSECDYAMVSVSDSGVGIAPELLTHIFEAGISGTGTTPGLGLAVCHRLMSQHDGTIRAHNLPSGGSLFELEFPI